MRIQMTKLWQRGIALAVLFAMLLTTLQLHQYITFADTVQTGIIVPSGGSLVTTRQAPSDSAAKANGLEYGKLVTILGKTTGDDGKLWYKISYVLKSNGKTVEAYCHDYEVQLDKPLAKAVLTANEVSVRDGVGTSGTNILIQLYVGHQVEILGSETASNGTLWYRIRYITPDNKTIIGWSVAKYYDITGYNSDPDYVKQLVALGFPESYANRLALPHTLYPEWVFEPVHTGLTWKEVIAGETKRPINMVPISYDDAKKSVADTEYDWLTNRWTIRDGDSWVAVHPDYLAYVMDPRNFMTEEYIFQFESLSYNASQTIEGVKAIIGSSFMSKDVVDSDGTTLNYANAFMSIAKEVGVSPYHLASRVLQEQGSKGTSSLISGTYKGYEGYYNYFNFGAHGITDAAVIQAGLKYAKGQGWNTRYKALKGGAEKIAANYIKRGQDTLYFQKFNVVWKDSLYGHQYMGAVDAPRLEGKKMGSAYKDKHQAFVFRIPVYKEMPENAVAFTAKGNRNNYLKDLNVSGLALTPTFNGATTNYTLTVGEAISSVSISATPVVSKAKISGTGTRNLVVGTNTVKILCTSESGDIRTYTITIVREGGEEIPQPPVDPENPENPQPPKDPAGISSDKYVIGKNITGVAPNTKAADFLAGFTMKGGATLKLLNAQGAENTGIVGTGNVLQVFDGATLIASYEIVIFGDVSGDGIINIKDVIKLNRHTLNISPLTKSYLAAADVNKNGIANIQDVIIANRHTLGLTTIAQR